MSFARIRFLPRAGFADTRKDTTRRAEARSGELQEVRPGWGPRLVAPGLLLIGLGVLGLDAGGVMAGMALAALVVGAPLWANLLFRHRVTWGAGEITLFDLTLTRHVRPLSALIDMRPTTRRAGHELIFENRQSLFIPAHLAKRGQFLSEMQDIIHDNTNNGLILPMTELRGSRTR